MNPQFYVQQSQQPPTTSEPENMYELIEMASTTGQEKEIEVEPNAAYGTVQRPRAFHQ